MKELKENSILINQTISVSWPQLEDKTELINLTNVYTKFNGAYCTNNSTIAFVTNEGVYVTPYTEIQHAKADQKRVYT